MEEEIEKTRNLLFKNNLTPLRELKCRWCKNVNKYNQKEKRCKSCNKILFYS